MDARQGKGLQRAKACRVLALENRGQATRTIETLRRLGFGVIAKPRNASHRVLGFWSRGSRRIIGGTWSYDADWAWPRVIVRWTCRWFSEVSPSYAVGIRFFRDCC